MNSRPAVPAPILLPGPEEALATMLRWIASAAGLFLFSLAALLLARRLGGAFQRPLSPGELLAAGAVLAAVAALIRLLARAPWGEARRGRMDWIGRWIPSAALAVLGIAISSPETAVWALILFWLMLAAEEGGWRVVEPWFARRRAAVRRPAGATSAAESMDPGRLAPSEAGVAVVDALDAGADRTPPQTLPANVSQQMTRSRREDGVEVLHGLLRGDFAPGQRSRSLHVAFCPPLDGTPRLKVEQLAGPPVSLKAGEVRPYGVRLDLRLPAAHADPVSVLVRLDARAVGSGEPIGESDPRRGAD